MLVTGGYGFIGTHLLRALMARGYRQVTVIDSFIHGKPPMLDGARNTTRFVQCDITSREAFDLVVDGGFDTVIHLAALHYIPYCDAHPQETCRTNIEGTQNLLTASAAAGVKRFFLASTAAVYEPGDRAHAETDPVRPVDVYGISKRVNEEQVALAARVVDCKFAIGRLFNAVGAHETNPHLIPEIVRRLRTSTAIEIGSLTPRRDYVHVADVADAVLAMTFGNTKSVDVCNIGSGTSYSVGDIVDRIAAITGIDITLTPADRYLRQVDRPFLQADNRKMASEYDWHPTRTLAEAIEDVIEFDAATAVPGRQPG